MARVGVVLSGCGVYDGAEIHEAVFTLLALDEADAEIVCMAPQGPQMHVIDHLNGTETKEQRDILVESARIARGDIKNLADVGADQLDAIVFPGGFGAAKNLCDFAVKGPDCTVNPEVARIVKEMHAARKPIGFACIAPAMAAAIFRDADVKGVNLTVGHDNGADAAQAIEAMGAVHASCPVTEATIDEAQRIVSTPAYMTAQRIKEVRIGIKAMVDEVLRRVE